MPAQNDRTTTIDLLRHGVCEGGEIYRGRTDVSLTAEGWQQMEQATDSSPGWKRIVTSPLLRCRTFSEHRAKQLQLPLQVESAMREMDFGEWEGRLLQDVWRENPDLVSRFYQDPEAVTPPGGESTVDALARITATWRELLQQYAGEELLLVCHGGVIRLLLSHLLDMPLSAIARLHIPYASITRVQIHHSERGDFPVLMSLNAGVALP
jgi:alpha-ribazole phosphatase